MEGEIKQVSTTDVNWNCPGPTRGAVPFLLLVFFLTFTFSFPCPASITLI